MKLIAVIMRTRPTAPLSMISRARRIGRSKLWLWPTIRMHAGLLRRLDHALAFGERERHRLFDQHVLAGAPPRARRARRASGAASRCRPPRRRDRRTALRPSHRPARRNPAAKLLARLGARIGGGDQSHARIARERRQHQREGAAEAGDADAQLAVAQGPRLAHRSITSSSRLRARHADHDVVGLLVLGQHEVAMVRLASQQPGPAGAAGAALARAWRRRWPCGAQRLQDGDADRHLDDVARARQPHLERLVVRLGCAPAR